MAGFQVPKVDKKLPVYMKMSELKKFLDFLEKDDNVYALRNEVMLL
ncbi:MAG: hypothetical protein ACQEWV_22565 [Bacillota bacterium]